MKYGPQTTRLLDYVKATHDTGPEFLWARTPDCAVLRNNYSRKWYGIIMVIPANKIGIKSDEKIEIVNVRFSKGEALDFTSSIPGIYPAWHMNKKNWITIVLDSALTDEQLFGLVEQSYSFSG